MAYDPSSPDGHKHIEPWPLPLRIVLFPPGVAWIFALALAWVAFAPVQYVRLLSRHLTLRARMRDRGRLTSWEEAAHSLQARGGGTILRLKSTSWFGETVWWLPESLSAIGCEVPHPFSHPRFLAGHPLYQLAAHQFFDSENGVAQLIDSSAFGPDPMDAWVRKLRSRYPALEEAEISDEVIRKLANLYG